MIYCFLVDTSPDMAAVVEDSVFTYLDLAKAFVESIFNALNKTSNFMLLTSEMHYQCLKTSLGEPPSVFEMAIKQLSTIPSSKVEHSLSYGLSFAFDIINKYRIKNGIESFSEGLRPWVIDPVHFFFISHKIQNITIRKTVSCGMDNILEAYRWDFKLFSVFIHPIEDVFSTDFQSNLNTAENEKFNSISLAHRMGGDVLQFHSMKEIISSIPSILPRISQVSVLVNMSLVTEDSNGKKTLLKMYPTSNFSLGYPIPEKYFVDTNTEHLSVRTAYPHLTLLNRRDYIEDASDYFHQALSLKIPIESYVVDSISTGMIRNVSAASANVLSSLGLHTQVKCMVCILPSEKSENKSYVPFGIMSHNLNSNTAILSMLPYNFPKLLPILSSLRMAQISNRPVSSQLSQDLVLYFKTLPLYCQPSVYALLLQFGLQQFIPTIPPYNKFLVRRIQKMKKSATDDILQLENSFK